MKVLNNLKFISLDFIINSLLSAYSFDSVDTPSSIIIDDNGNIKAATLEKLVEKLTSYQYSSNGNFTIILILIQS